MNEDHANTAPSATASNSLVPYVLVCVGIILILQLENLGVRVLLSVAVLCLVAWALSRKALQPGIKLGMMSALSRQDEALQILPNEKYSPNGFPTNEKPRDFALTLRTILSRDGVIDCLAHHLEHDLQWEVNRMQDPVSEDGTRVDLVVYPDPGMTTVYHVSAYARNARPGIVRVRVRPGKVPTKAHPGS